MASSRINSIERSYSDGRANGRHQQSSEEVHQEINRIRGEMDHTLEEIGDYLHPKHLLDYVVDSIRSGSAGSSKETVREYANQGVSALKRHPGPALLMGGAVLWYLMEQNRDEGDLDDTGRMGSRRGTPRAATYGAWEEGYDWSSSEENEQTWSEKARQTLDQVRTVVADKTIAAKDKVKHVARHMVGASGKSREELHTQWANLREHSGSFVDARTGQPYDDRYGDTAWSQAEACACLCDENADDSSWSGKAEGVVNSMSESLKNTGASVKEQFRSLGGHLLSLVSSGSSRVGDLASAGRERMGDMASRSGRSMARGWESASSGLHSAADSARHGMSRVGSTVSSSIRQGSDSLQRTVQEQPLAVGAACLGLGLLAGLLAPATRRENELMGEASDRLKDQAREAGEQAMERGKEVVGAATSAVKEEANRP
jgi:ElaB/YqjD/DUF883 family membrane-anchored ribosome-binding protein